MGKQPSSGSCDVDIDRKRNCEEEQKEGEEGQKKEESIRRQTEVILNCAREQEKLRNWLSEDLSLMAKPEDLTQLLQRLLKTQSLQQSFLSQIRLLATHLSIAEKEKISGKKRFFKMFLVQRSPELKERLVILNREVKRITIERKEKAVEADLHRCKDLSSKNSVTEAFGVLKETLRTYRLIWFYRANKTTRTSYMQFQLHYETLFEERNIMDADLQELIQEGAPDNCSTHQAGQKSSSKPNHCPPERQQDRAKLRLIYSKPCRTK